MQNVYWTETLPVASVPSTMDSTPSQVCVESDIEPLRRNLKLLLSRPPSTNPTSSSGNFSALSESGNSLAFHTWSRDLTINVLYGTYGDVLRILLFTVKSNCVIKHTAVTQQPDSTIYVNFFSQDRHESPGDSNRLEWLLRPVKMRPDSSIRSQQLILAGRWYNELGSSMEIYPTSSAEGHFSGWYHTGVGEAEGKYDLVGMYDTSKDGTQRTFGWWELNINFTLSKELRVCGRPGLNKFVCK